MPTPLRHQLETPLAYATLAVLALYVPLETWVSWKHGLLNPFYLVDVIAMVLLFTGAMRSLAARPRSAPGVLCAGMAWSAANGWRATFRRMLEPQRGGALDYGAAELWTVAAATSLSLVCLAVSIYLVVRAEDAETATSASRRAAP
jgi:hypothetical protein